MKFSDWQSWKKILLVALCMAILSICLLVITTGYFLKQGVTIENLTFGGTSVSGISAIWKAKLRVDIDSVTMGAQEGTQKTHSNKGSYYSLIIRLVRFFPHFFSRIAIHELQAGSLKGTFLLEQQENRIYLCEFMSKGVELRSTIRFELENLDIEIVKASISAFQFNGRGDIRIHYNGENEVLVGSLGADIASSFPINLTFTADEEKLSFKGSEAGTIHTIKPLVDLFGLEYNIQRWITAYLKSSRFNLKSVKGEMFWNNPAGIIDTLQVEIRVDDCEYTFAPGLEPIKAKFTDVVFSNSVLVITPRESTFYGQAVGNSGLNIDFNDLANIILSVHIKTSAIANEDILLLLDYYNISLPFTQIGGTTKTDLELTINLNKILIEARGDIKVTDATIEYNEDEYQVANARILLENSDVIVDHLEVGFEDLWHAYISGKLFLKKSVGNLSVTLKQFNIPLNDAGESKFQLDQAHPPPIFHYRIGPEGHTIESGYSNWLMSEIEVEVAPFSTPFYMDDLKVMMDGVQVKTVPGGEIIVSGPASIKKKTADLKCALRQFQYGGILLESEELAFNVTFGDGIVVKSKNQSRWSLNTVPTNLSPFELGYRHNVLSLTTTKLRYGELLDTLMSGSYNTASRAGAVSFEKVSLINRKIDKELSFEEDFVVQLTGEKQDFVAKIPELGFVLSRDIDNNWSVNLNDLSLIHRHSTILSKYNISDGFIKVSLANGQEPFTYTAKINNPYLIVTDDSGPVDKLTITGEVASKSFSALINDKLHIEYADSRFQAHAKQLGLNIPGMISLIENHNDSLSVPLIEEDSKSFQFSLVAEDSHLLFSPNSRLLADHVLLELSGNAFTLDLKHGPGSIQLRADGEQFTLEGNGLNDSFMSGLIGGSRFEKGGMSVAAKGTFDRFSAIFELKNTVLKHLKIVNNIMAFINIAPALATFSLPGYSTTGLVVRYAVVGMAFADKNATIESIEVDSSQMNVEGVGSIDFSERLINLNLKLISQAKSNLGKIPVVGYIVTGDKKKRFKAINISGPFDDPIVKHSLLRDFIAQPVKMLARTLSLPFYLVKKIVSSSEERKTTQSAEQSSATVATETE